MNNNAMASQDADFASNSAKDIRHLNPNESTHSAALQSLDEESCGTPPSPSSSRGHIDDSESRIYRHGSRRDASNESRVIRRHSSKVSFDSTPTDCINAGSSPTRASPDHGILKNPSRSDLASVGPVLRQGSYKSPYKQPSGMEIQEIKVVVEEEGQGRTVASVTILQQPTSTNKGDALFQSSTSDTEVKSNSIGSEPAKQQVSVTASRQRSVSAQPALGDDSPSKSRGDESSSPNMADQRRPPSSIDPRVAARRRITANPTGFDYRTPLEIDEPLSETAPILMRKTSGTDTSFPMVRSTSKAERSLLLASYQNPTHPMTRRTSQTFYQNTPSTPILDAPPLILTNVLSQSLMSKAFDSEEPSFKFHESNVSNPLSIPSSRRGSLKSSRRGSIINQALHSAENQQIIKQQLVYVNADGGLSRNINENFLSRASTTDKPPSEKKPRSRKNTATSRHSRASSYSSSFFKTLAVDTKKLKVASTMEQPELSRIDHTNMNMIASTIGSTKHEQATPTAMAYYFNEQVGGIIATTEAAKSSARNASDINTPSLLSEGSNSRKSGIDVHALASETESKKASAILSSNRMPRVFSEEYRRSDDVITRSSYSNKKLPSMDVTSHSKSSGSQNQSSASKIQRRASRRRKSRGSGKLSSIVAKLLPTDREGVDEDTDRDCKFNFCLGLIVIIPWMINLYWLASRSSWTFLYAVSNLYPNTYTNPSIEF
jgi:hypothetical protein